MSDKNISIFIDSSIAAGSTDTVESAVIPAGKNIEITEFGGCDIAIGDGIDSIMAIQRWNGSAWKTIRGWTGKMQFNSQYNFAGDGVIKFRVVRINQSAVAKKIFCWLRAGVVTRESYL